MRKVNEETASENEIQTKVSSEMKRRVTMVCGDEIDPPVEIVLALVANHHFRQTPARLTMHMLARLA